MLNPNVLRGLGAASKGAYALLQARGLACGLQLQPLGAANSSRGYATGAQLSKKDVVNMLGSTDDPEVAAAVKDYLKSAYAAGDKAPAAPAEPTLALTESLERKYAAAQIVEYGIQSTAAPLADSEIPAAVKRYAAGILDISAKAGFEDPYTEVTKRLAGAAKTADTVKEVLIKAKSVVSPDFHAALLEALSAVEADTGSAVTLDGASAGYKQFAQKVKELATQHKIPVDLLVGAKKSSGLAEDAKDKLQKEYKAWLQEAVAQDAKAEIEALKAEATSLLDLHLSKTASQIKKEQQATLQSVLRKVEASKGQVWAEKFAADTKFLAWFDSAVAKNPTKGPVASA